MSWLTRAVLVAVVAALGACGGGGGGSTPGSPTAPSPTPVPTSTTVVATLTNVITRAPIGTANHTVNQLPARIEYSQPGFVTRSAWVTSAQPAIELIPDAAPFSLEFYRDFVRGTYEEGRQPLTIRRWTSAPMVFIQTVDSEGAAVPVALLDSIESTIRETTPLFTGERFGVATVERGTGTREGQAGWVTVKFPTETRTENAICGRATVGPSGYIEFFYRQGGGCRCGTLAIRPRTVRHELGHAMGFWHTDSTSDTMSGVGVAGCDGRPSERERLHASIAYGRPNGNADIDTDPATSLTTTRLPPPIVIDD